MSRLLSKPWVRDLFFGAALLIATAGLLLMPQASMSAVRDGLSLCYNVMIPSLFPFFVLSSLVVELGLVSYIGRVLEPVMRPLFRVGGICASALTLGLIGGYPVGATTAIRLYENGMCSKTEAERLLAFCNNSGPAFILGVVGVGIFSSSLVGLLLYLAHAAASVCVGLIFRFYKGSDDESKTPKVEHLFHVKQFGAALTDCIKGAFSSVLNICAFVVFFTVLIRLLSLSGILPALAVALGTLLAPLGFSPAWGERLLIGLLELSSGVASLSFDGALAGRLPMAAFMLGWAGISVHCQVLSFIGKSGLSSRTYFVGKLLHGGISALFVWALGRAFPFHAPVGAYLSEQVSGLAGLTFSSALSYALSASFLLFLLFFLLALSCRKRRRTVLQCRK